MATARVKAKRSAAESTAALVERCTEDLMALPPGDEIWPQPVREDELEALLEALCSVRRGSAALIGEYESSSLRLVGELAIRIIAGTVPKQLAGRRVVHMEVGPLFAGANSFEKVASRLSRVLRALRKKPTILYISDLTYFADTPGGSDLCDYYAESSFREVLAEWPQACVLLCSESIFDLSVGRHTELSRRFAKVRVRPPTAEESLLDVLLARDDCQEKTGVRIDDEVVRAVVRFVEENQPDKCLPRQAIRLVDRCAAAAAVKGEKVLLAEPALRTARRAIGLADTSPAALERLRGRLLAEGVVTEEEAELICSRLGASLGGGTTRAERPPGIVLLLGEAAAEAGRVSALIAAELFGDAERVVSVDLSRFDEEVDATLLLGRCRGAGSPLSDLLEQPASVLCLQEAHAAHRQVRSALSASFERGALCDSRGGKIPVGHAIIVIGARTLPRDEAGGRALGFGRPPAAPGSEAEVGEEADRQRGLRLVPAAAVAKAVLGERLAGQCDAVVGRLGPAGWRPERGGSLFAGRLHIRSREVEVQPSPEVP